MHATPKSTGATTAAIDVAKDVFELAFADADARIVDRRRLTRMAFAKAFENRAPLHVSNDTQFHALWRHPDLRTPGRWLISCG